MDKKFKKEFSKITQSLTIDNSENEVIKKFNYTTYPLLHNEALYVLDVKNKEITYQKNIEKILGYSEAEFNFDSVFGIVHPDDLPVVRKILLATLEHSAKHGISNNSTFRISFRARKKNGKYIKVQRTSGVSRQSPNKTIRGQYSIIQDISYLGLTNAVKWEWDSPTANIAGYRKFVNLSPVDLFTERENEVFILLKNGLNSNAVANELGLSPHTIAGYRKNMLRKANCKSTFEMIQMFDLGSLYKLDK